MLNDSRCAESGKLLKVLSDFGGSFGLFSSDLGVIDAIWEDLFCAE